MFPVLLLQVQRSKKTTCNFGRFQLLTHAGETDSDADGVGSARADLQHLHEGLPTCAGGISFSLFFVGLICFPNDEYNITSTCCLPPCKGAVTQVSRVSKQKVSSHREGF